MKYNNIKPTLLGSRQHDTQCSYNIQQPSLLHESQI